MVDQRTQRTPLTWGHGSVEVEFFLDPTCPFSNKAFKKIKPFVALMGEEAVTVRVYLHVQPWHLFSGLIARTALAAALSSEGREDAWRVLEVVAEHRDEFDAIDHCRGALMAVTPTEIRQRIEGYAGLKLSDFFEKERVTAMLKRQTRYARQNGIHTTPTVMLNGLIDERFGSGDDVETWVEYCTS
ncbi:MULTISPECIES: thioredoxin domain-containing protein [unclassified Saccharibacter]|uniref:DsbA family protein n=1 Tax=unclassified Saccharibacter TaxID=2648722 RepID=UPI00132BCFAC|nr:MULTISPECIES: thioredoxin domain-containing protein [unclassified Saccharibacter]MXV35697.1 thioredoxin domain-containing protein [Saccharibacter sp. EH611]MXV58311.1 thioredoxin domain-containing protein [Saccharibacter sp. EH70]MXV65787.1 thioredoxin domain-containing protein [Saccharibacter sp. EH60]